MTRTYRNTYLGFLSASFLLSAFMWFHVRTTFDSVTLGDVALSVLFIVFSVALFMLALLLFTARETFGIFTVFCAGFLLLLPFHAPYILAVVFALLIFAYAAMEIRNGANNRLTISFYSLLVYGVPTLLTALALLYGFVGYFYPFNLENAHVTSVTFSKIVPQLEKLAATKFSYYRAGMSIDEFFTASAQGSVKAQFGSVPKQAEALIASQVAQQREALSKQFKTVLSGKEGLGEILSIATNAYLKRYLGSDKYKDIVPLFVALSVFLSIKSVGFILDRLAVVVVWLVVKALMASGVMLKRTIPAERETLTIA